MKLSQKDMGIWYVRFCNLSFNKFQVCLFFLYTELISISVCILYQLLKLFTQVISLCLESARPPSKRRKRKGSASTNAASGNMNNRDAPPSGKQKRSPGPQGFNLGSTVPGVSGQLMVIQDFSLNLKHFLMFVLFIICLNQVNFCLLLNYIRRLLFF